MIYYGGVKHAYMAYATLLKDIVSEPPLRRLERYFPRQMFWIFYAKLWCSKYTTKSDRRVIVADSQMSNEILVNVLLRGLPEFSDDFYCKPQDFMNFNSYKTCNIW